MNAYDTGFQYWKSARDALALAVDNYVDASNMLSSTLMSSLRSGAPQNLLERTLSGIDLELPSLELDHEKLDAARATLGAVRNSCQTAVPINQLPPDILLNIFTLSSGKYTRFDRTATFRSEGSHSPSVLAGVCGLWRNIILESPCLWSTIYLTICNFKNSEEYNRAALWIERSAQAPLLINIEDYQPGSFHLEGIDEACGSDLIEVLKFLEPLGSRIQALSLELLVSSELAVSLVMRLWVENCSAAPGKTLQIINGWDHVSSVLGPNKPISTDQFTRFFASVSRINLQYCYIPKFIPFHEGLVDLCLGYMDPLNRLNQEDLVRILSVTPRLRMFSLADCQIQRSDVTPHPVTLNHLESLSLESHEVPPSSVYVLPLINTGTQKLDMSLTLGDNSPEFKNEVRLFFARSRVVRLLVWQGVTARGSLEAIFCPMLHLRTLAIERFDISDNSLGGGIQTILQGRAPPPWPALHVLHFRLNNVDLDCLEAIVRMHPIKKLHMHDPRIIGAGEMEAGDEGWTKLHVRFGAVEDFHIFFEEDYSEMDTWDFSVLVE
ncbi:isoamyl alcohol oxidase [Ceratobasidium sp. AG-Ba]|nr:isoamyl alcohol oxidase [Ceratobasidium sp. AG-Ba]